MRTREYLELSNRPIPFCLLVIKINVTCIILPKGATVLPHGIDEEVARAFCSFHELN